MGANVTFAAVEADEKKGIKAERQVGPFQADNDALMGYRVGMIFRPHEPAVAIGNHFVVQLLVARFAGVPQRPKELMNGEGPADVSHFTGRKATVTINRDGPDYTFRQIDLSRVENFALLTDNHQVCHCAWLTFRYASSPLRFENGPAEEKFVDMRWTGAAASLDRDVGSAGLTLSNDVITVAKAHGAPAAGTANNVKQLESASLVKEAAGAGALVFVTPRDAANEWLNALLIQNFGQHEGKPPPVPGGKLTLVVNNTPWPVALTHETVAAYLVEEVWGSCEHLAAISATQACELIPPGLKATDALRLDSWLMRSFEGIAMKETTPDPAGKVKERVCIRYKGGLQTAGLFG